MAHPKVTFGRNYTIDMIRDSKPDKRKSVRLRTPDHLPMNHSAAQTRQQAMQQRQRRLTTSNDVRKACIDSGSLRQYSRRRFEFAVQNASNQKDRGRDVPRPYTTPNMPSNTSNNSLTGPTMHGSLLYNRIPLMLNSIRVRPQSESVMFSHSSPAYPDIDRTLRQSNCEFAVRSTPVSRGHSMTSRSRGVTSRCSSTDYMLIPLHDQLDVREFLPDDSEEEDTWPSIPPQPQVVLQMTGATVKDRCRIDNMSDTSSEGRPFFNRPTQNNTSNQPTGPQVRRTLPPYPPNDVRSRLAVYRSVSKGSGSDQSMSGSVSSTGSTRSERPKCWVDDVTISSEKSEVNEEEVDVAPVDDIKQRPGNITTDKGKQKGKQDTKKVRVEEIAPADDKIVADDKQPEVQEEAEVKEDSTNATDLTCDPEYVFPAFLCPSSERKSRQAAIKLWLARTCFTCADKNVPLFW